MRKNKFIKITVFAIIIAMIVLNAWLCDDAYISFRVIKNFVNGFGLRWNTFERVQVFTNPLMVIFLIPFYFLTHEIYYTSIFFNIIASSLAIYFLVFKISKNDWISIILMILLILSKSFMSFTTSGLENCLTFLLFSIFYYFFLKKDIYNKKDILLLSFISSLILLNRMDSILLIIPSLIYMFIKREKNISFINFCIYFTIGMLPFIIWEIFSLIYYGFLFPNTYYAKLNTGIKKIDYIINGIIYLITIFIVDPATILIIAFGTLLIHIFASKKQLCLIIGILLSIIYIVYVGGDFMLGRFLTPALFVTTIGISQLKHDILRTKHVKFIISAALLFYIASNINFIYRKIDVTAYQLNGVADERAYYYNLTSLFKVGSEKKINNLNYQGDLAYNNKVYLVGNIGFKGYFAKESDIIIDYFALSDPLLARIPKKDAKLIRIGHIERDIPAGYINSVFENKNLIFDKNLKEYYNAIKVITQDEIFSKERIKTIIKFNLGKYNYLIDEYLKK